MTMIRVSHNYSTKSGILQNYSGDETDDVHVDDSPSDGKSLEYKTKIKVKHKKHHLTPDVQKTQTN